MENLNQQLLNAAAEENLSKVELLVSQEQTLIILIPGELCGVFCSLGRQY